MVLDRARGASSGCVLATTRDADPVPPFLPAARLSLQLGKTALYVASFEGRSEVVARLIAARAEVNAANKVVPCTCEEEPFTGSPSPSPSAATPSTADKRFCLLPHCRSNSLVLRPSCVSALR